MTLPTTAPLEWVSSLISFKAPSFCPGGKTPQCLPCLLFLGALTCPGVHLSTTLSQASQPLSSLRGLGRWCRLYLLCFSRTTAPYIPPPSLSAPPGYKVHLYSLWKREKVSKASLSNGKTEKHPGDAHLPHTSQVCHPPTLPALGVPLEAPSMYANPPASARLQPFVPHSPDSSCSSTASSVTVMTQQHTQSIGKGKSLPASAWLGRADKALFFGIKEAEFESC